MVIEALSAPHQLISDIFEPGTVLTSEAGLSSTLAQDLNKGDCLYVGSAYSKTGSLAVRLGQHFGPGKGSEPRGLALNYSTRNVVNGKVKVVIFPLKREFKKYVYLFCVDGLNRFVGWVPRGVDHSYYCLS